MSTHLSVQRARLVLTRIDILAMEDAELVAPAQPWGMPILKTAFPTTSVRGSTTPVVEPGLSLLMHGMRQPLTTIVIPIAGRRTMLLSTTQ